MGPRGLPAVMRPVALSVLLKPWRAVGMGGPGGAADTGAQADAQAAEIWDGRHHARQTASRGNSDAAVAVTRRGAPHGRSDGHPIDVPSPARIAPIKEVPVETR